MSGPIDRAGLKDRLAALPPQKRELLRKLLESSEALPPSAARLLGGVETPAPAPGLAAAAPEPDVPITRESIFQDATKDKIRHFYERISGSLDGSEVGSLARFLNLGYLEGEGETQDAVIELPPHCLNRNSIKLVLELIADAEIDGKRVLDVGCGRGGTAWVMTEYFSPRRVVGVDLCGASVRFSHRSSLERASSFAQGDAERLPLADASFDVVSNVESSHSYPRLPDFYSEVARVLRPGGVFLYTDVLRTATFERALPELEKRGFVLERNKDVTAGVLRACRQGAAAHLHSIPGGHDPAVMNEFVSLPGSQLYEDMAAGRSQFRALRLRRSAA